MIMHKEESVNDHSSFDLIDNIKQAGKEESTFADMILAYLSSIKVEYVFGVPGGAIEPLYNSLARMARKPVDTTNTRIKAVVARHETGAAFMADGYARETGRLGVCCGTTGPGTTNLITGVASAYADRTPMLVITAQTALHSFGKRGLQESSSDTIDTVAMFESITNYNTLVSHPAQLEGKLFIALLSAFHEPQGPVHISIPLDILNFYWNGQATFKLNKLLRKPEVIDHESTDTLCGVLSSASKIVLFLGSGCREAIPAIMKFAEMLGIPFVTTVGGKSWVNAYHPLYRGVFGFAGHKTALDTLLDKDVDVVLAVGTSLGELSTGGWNKEALLNEKLIHIEETAENFVRSPMARLHVYGHLKTVFLNLNQVFATLTHRQGVVEPQQNVNYSQNTDSDKNTYYVPGNIELISPEKLLSENIPIKPQRLMFELVKTFPDHTYFVIDAGNSWAWATHYLHPKEAGHYRIGLGLGSMTWAIGASIGTAFAVPGKPVVCITGDGSFLMSGQEISVAIQHKLPVIFVILNDSALGMVKHGQRLGGGEPIGFELPQIDYATIARAMGAQAYTIKSIDDFADLDIAAICQPAGPTLLDVYVDVEEVPPMGERIKVLDRRKVSRRSSDYYNN
jgi:acetolactate synthase I/II/III large subunit